MLIHRTKTCASMQVRSLTIFGSLARRAGVAKVVLCRNGDLIRLAPGDPAIIDEVPSGRLYKDGGLLLDAQARTVADRRRLGFVGIVSVALAMTERGEMVGDLELEMTGIPETDAEGNLIARLTYNAVVEAIDSMPRPRRRDPDAVAEAARRANSGRRNSRSTGNNSQSLRPRSIKFKSESFERTGRKIFLYFLPTKREYRDARRLPKFSMPSHRTFPGLSEDRPISVLPLKRG